ncbi:hypothetical protein AJ80_01895 [Polytolypa hystricis UAMH7299]|uniref:Ribosomal RNA-processing protein 43 n=1 Tax=Polytolypa hystricis (strain UAMH7299) TaxID=1447883 RepID=A0A2B7Z0P7_POLH7|nr:hypothetical protein AJ80_01895 [Polytolypa hystricis UAMH7299]
MAQAVTPPKAASAPQIAPSLSLPPSQFARLQPHAYLLSHLSPSTPNSRPSLRVNGRSKSQSRPVSVNKGSLTHTNGSAVVRIGDTAAVCGVRAELLSTDDIAAWKVSSSTSQNPSLSKRRKTETTQGTDGSESEEDDDESQIQSFNLLVPNLSLSTGCSPSFAPGAPPSSFAQSLSHQLLALLHSSRLVRAEDLRVWFTPPDFSTMGEDVDMDSEEASETSTPEIKAFWSLYIDILIISLAGNPFDAAWAAVVAALQDTRLPKAWWDIDSEMILCSDDVSESRKLRLRGLPVSSSFAVFEADAAAEWRAVVPQAPSSSRTDGKGKGKAKEEDVDSAETPERWILADPDTFEESLCSEHVCVVVDKDPRQPSKVKILKIEKNGGLSVGREELRSIVGQAAERWDEVRSGLEGSS